MFSGLTNIWTNKRTKKVAMLWNREGFRKVIYERAWLEGRPSHLISQLRKFGVARQIQALQGQPWSCSILSSTLCALGCVLEGVFWVANFFFGIVKTMKWFKNRTIMKGIHWKAPLWLVSYVSIQCLVVKTNKCKNIKIHLYLIQCLLQIIYVRALHVNVQKDF